MKLLSSKKNQVASLLSSGIWCIYLTFFVWLSFLPVRFDTPAWQTFLFCFYLFLGFYCLCLLLGVSLRHRGLANAKNLILLLVLGQIWLLLQEVLPNEARSFMAHANLSALPDWFNPAYKLSIVPVKTHLLLLSEVFVFSLMVISLCLINSRKRLKQILVAFGVVGGLHALIALLAYWSKTHLVDMVQLDGHFNVARGIFVNRNHLSAFLVLCLVGSISFIYKYHFTRYNNLAAKAVVSLFLPVAAFSFSVICILASQSRGGLLSLVVSLLIVVAFTRLQIKSFTINWKLVFLVLIGFGFVFFYFGSVLLERFSQEGISLGERPTQWLITLRAIADAPWLGFGGGSYGTVFQVYREQAELRQVIYNQAHNQFLHVWLEQGFVGLALWVSVLGLVIKNSLFAFKYNKSALIGSCNGACLIVISAAVLQSGVDFNLQILNIRAYFFVIIALVFASPHIRQRLVNK